MGGVTLIGDLVDQSVENAVAQMRHGKLDLRSIIYQAVQAGMADAYERGIAKGKEIANQSH